MTSNITNFVTYQNSIRSGYTWATGANGSVFTAGATATGNDAIAWNSGSTTLAQGYNNAVVLDGPRTQYDVQIDGTGHLHVLDASSGQAASGQTMDVTNDTYILFNGGSASSGSGVYDNLMIIATGNDATLARLYQATFGRMPDLPGLEAWRNQIDSGLQTISQVAQDFIASNEFQTRYGVSANLTDTQFVSALYTNVLGRNADSSGETAWVAYLGQETAAVGTTAARGMVLLDFATSNEEITNSSSWLVDPAKGGYADAGVKIDASTVINQSFATNYLNLNLADPSTMPTAATPYNWVQETSGGTAGAGYVLSTTFAALLQPNATVFLSTQNSVCIYGTGETVYTGSGVAKVVLQIDADNVSVVLQDSAATEVQISNTLWGTAGHAPINLKVTLFVPGTDYIETPLITANTRGSPELLDASNGQAYSGANLVFTTYASTSAFPVSNGGKTYILDVGAVGSGTAAEVVAAANKVYTPAAVAGESLVIIGQTSSGDTVVYDWAGYSLHTANTPIGPTTRVTPDQLPGLTADHHIAASGLTLEATLVGVTTSALTAHDFQ